MIMNDRDRILNCFQQFAEEFRLINIDEITPFREMGVNSVNFVTLIVRIEDELDIEFEDEMLDFNKITNLKEMIDYSLSVKENN